MALIVLVPIVALLCYVGAWSAAKGWHAGKRREPWGYGAYLADREYRNRKEGDQ